MWGSLSQKASLQTHKSHLSLITNYRSIEMKSKIGEKGTKNAIF